VTFGDFAICSVKPIFRIGPQAAACQMLVLLLRGRQSRPQGKQGVTPRHDSTKRLTTRGARRHMIVKGQQLSRPQPPPTVACE
jgi:hypothetical protein